MATRGAKCAPIYVSDTVEKLPSIQQSEQLCLVVIVIFMVVVGVAYSLAIPLCSPRSQPPH